MANYKLEIYKIPSVEVTLVQAIEGKRNSLIMVFEDNSLLKRNDLLWAESDMAQNLTDQMIVIKGVMSNGRVRVRRPEGHDSLEGLRAFNGQEKFKVVASFISVQDGSTTLSNTEGSKDG